MHRPTIAVYWHVWKRYRWWWIASSVWFLAVSSLCYAIADGVVFGVGLLVHEDAVLFMFLLAAGPFMCGLIPLFAYAVDAEIVSKESTFPTRMFTLPLTTRALVGWPMIYGTVAVALAWLAVASLVLRPGGMDVPLWWPAAAMAVGMAWFQAIMWRPFGLPGSRIVAAVLVMDALTAAVAAALMCDAPQWGIPILLVCGMAPAYLVAVSGVGRARRGDQPDWPWLATMARTVAGWFSLRGRSFGSPSRAQVWFEWRRGGLGLPIAVGLMILFLAILIAVSRHNPRLPPNSPLRSPILLLGVPLFVSALVGGSWGNCGRSRRVEVIPAFLATRPMTCGGLIWAKMKAAAISVAVVWGMALAAVVLMFLLTGSWGELAGQFSVLTKDFSAAQKAAMVPLGVVLLLASTFKPMIANMFLGLAGRNWVWTVGALVIGPALGGAVLIGCWVYMHPEFHDDLLAAVPWLLGSAAVLKLILGGWLVRAVVRRQLVETRLMARLLGAWLIIAVGLSGLLCWLVPTKLAAWYLLAACAVLAMPLVRIWLAPLALAWNRHR